MAIFPFICVDLFFFPLYIVAPLAAVGSLEQMTEPHCITTKQNLICFIDIPMETKPIAQCAPIFVMIISYFNCPEISTDEHAY